MLHNCTDFYILMNDAFFNTLMKICTAIIICLLFLVFQSVCLSAIYLQSRINIHSNALYAAINAVVSMDWWSSISPILPVLSG